MPIFPKLSFNVFLIFILLFGLIELISVVNLTWFEPIQTQLKNKSLSSLVTHWNSTEHVRPPTIYMCTNRDSNGFREAKKMFFSILPEYTQDVLGASLANEYFSPIYTNPYDVFIDEFKWMGGCSNKVLLWLLTTFNGHIILFSGESYYGYPLGDRPNFHRFGPLQDSTSNDMVLTYMQYVWWDKIQYTLTPEMLTDAKKRPRSKPQTFMVYANSNCVEYREKAVASLSRFGEIHCAGKCQGMVGVSSDAPVNRTNIINTKDRYRINIGNWWNNIDVYSQYKFCLVMEHTGQNTGYISEKILLAFSAGCIPVYYGSNSIFDIFNSKAFVFYDLRDPQPALDQIKALNENNDLYHAMMNEPIAANGLETLQNYFSFNDTIGGGKLKTEIRKKLGLTDDNFFP